MATSVLGCYDSASSTSFLIRHWFITSRGKRSTDAAASTHQHALMPLLCVEPGHTDGDIGVEGQETEQQCLNNSDLRATTSSSRIEASQSVLLCSNSVTPAFHACNHA